jgi:hypothetical protein
VFRSVANDMSLKETDAGVVAVSSAGTTVESTFRWLLAGARRGGASAENLQRCSESGLVLSTFVFF